MNEAIVQLCSGALVAWSFTVSAVGVEAIRRSFAREKQAREPARLEASPRVLVVRPVAGDEPRLLANMRSILRAQRSFELRYRIAVADAYDSAYPVALRAAWWLRACGVDAQVVVTGASGPNRKASQLARVIAEERGNFDVVMVADSDVSLSGTKLDRLIAPLMGEQAASAAWAPPAELGRERTRGDRAAAALLGASLHAFVLLAGLDRTGFVGKLFAVRRDALEAIGGFDALTEHLGEDMELGRRILAQKGSIVAAPVVARATPEGRSLRTIVSRFGRWLMVIRAQRPWLLASYPLLFFATPLILLASLALMRFAPIAALVAASAALASRAAVALTASRAAGRRVSWLRAITDAAVADLLLATAFVRALGPRTIVWRSVVLTIDRAGVLRERAT